MIDKEKAKRKRYLFFDIDRTLTAGGYQKSYVPESAKLALAKMRQLHEELPDPDRFVWRPDVPRPWRWNICVNLVSRTW